MWQSIVLSLMMLVFVSTFGVPIETPEVEERNEFVIQAPSGWGYRTFKGKNGLIGVLWPEHVSFNMTDTAIFVFLETAGISANFPLDNLNLFEEKCPQASFVFPDIDQSLSSEEKEKYTDTLSLGEKYFRGRCGKTMILFKETISQYTLIFALISARYVSKKEFADAKQVVRAYKNEVESSLGIDNVNTQ